MIVAMVDVPIEQGAPAPQLAGAAAQRIEIPIVTPSTGRCDPRPNGEIVVCATDPEAYRLRPIPQDGESRPVKAEVKLGEGASAAVTGQATDVGGWPSNRIMATVKIAF